jgi:spermidine/putrescine transport system substrate-binding protein
MLLVMISAITMLLAFGAAAQDDDANEITWTCPEGFAGQTLSIYNWATYIGETTVSDFEALCGVRVIYDVYDSNESMIARLRQGNPGYDIAIPSDYAIVIMIREGLVQPIDLNNIPNYANIDDRWKDLFFDPENEYSVPYLWGTFGVGYNVNQVGEEITSWQQVFDHNGPVAWVDDSRSMIGIALNLLGYDPNSMDPDEIAEARGFLIDNGRNVIAVAADDGQALLARGEVDIALEYSGDILQIIEDCDCDDFAYVIPEEGSIVDIASMVILDGAPNPSLAEVFMDYVLDPVVGAGLTAFTGYPTPNKAAIEAGLIDEDMLNDPIVFPPDDIIELMWFNQDVDEAEQDYNDAWDEILILIGS